MRDDLAWLRPDAAEPLDAHASPLSLAGPLAGLRGQRLEFTSRGDRVPARLLLPARSDGPCPLVLLQHGAGGSKSTDYLDAAAGPWVRGGAAVLSIDFPLHGERANAKLGQRLFALLARPEPGPSGESLWRDFARQSVVDLQRALDAAASVPEVDARRIAYASFSLGTLLGGIFLGVDARPRAAALALGGAGLAPAEMDPASHIGRFAPRPVLFVNATRDERIPRESAEALHAAAGEPKRVEWYDASHQALPGRALKSMWLFLRGELGLGAGP